VGTPPVLVAVEAVVVVVRLGVGVKEGPAGVVLEVVEEEVLCLV
jgi:hypothetical protein